MRCDGEKGEIRMERARPERAGPAAPAPIDPRARELLQAIAISKRFGGVQALDGVSLEIRVGEIACLAGENGSGKSTLIKIIAGVHRPDAGAIRIGGREQAALRPIDAIREGIHVIYQDLALFPNLSVAENLALSTLVERRERIVRPHRVRAIAEEALRELGAELPLRRTVSEISMAERQLVAIGRALLGRPRLLIMDEPTAALTQREVDSLFAVLRRLRERGIAVLFVSHKLKEVMEVSERIVVLRSGRKVAEGPTAELDLRTLARHMTGREVGVGRVEGGPLASSEGRSAAEGTAPLLEVEGLGRRGAFEDVSFSLREGEVLGVAGLLGSGRTALALSLFGLKPADRGRILLCGTPALVRSVRDALRLGIAYVPEDRVAEGLFLEQSLERNINVSVLDRLVLRAAGLGRLGLLDRARSAAHAAEWIEALEISAPSPRVPVQLLSGGNQQKAVLARGLAAKARVLILNGPTVGVDIGAKAAIHEKVRELARSGLGVVLISDDLPELVALSSRILILHRGKVEGEIAAEETDEDRLNARLGGLR
jgi:simple sugar transport system ATP-binding protein